MLFLTVLPLGCKHHEGRDYPYFQHAGTEWEPNEFFLKKKNEILESKKTNCNYTGAGETNSKSPESVSSNYTPHLSVSARPLTLSSIILYF